MEPQAPPPQSTGLSKIQITILVSALCALIAAFFVADRFNPRQSQSARPENPAPVLTSEQRAEAQSAKNNACAIVDRLKRAGAFTKIEGGYSGVTHAYADHGFLQIPVDAKESAMKAVALCYIDVDKKDQMGIVIIHNGYSGKRIGSFDFASGLEMD